MNVGRFQFVIQYNIVVRFQDFLFFLHLCLWAACHQRARELQQTPRADAWITKEISSTVGSVPKHNCL